MTLHAEMDSNYSLIDAHEIVDKIERNIKNKYKIDLLIHIDPIDFNNDVLKNLLDDEVSQFSEFEIDIFETVSNNDSQYLGTVEEKEEDEDEVYDSDHIN